MKSREHFSGDIVLLGMRVVFASDDAQLLQRVTAAYESWADRQVPAGGSSVYVVIETGTWPDREPIACGTKLATAMDGAWLEADGETGVGRALLPPDPPAGDALVATLNTIVLFLLGHRGRIPLHASAILLGDAAIVFAGRSGAGKSILALAAQRTGLAVFSEDTIFVQTAPRLRLWSLARAIHVLAEDAPEQAGAGMRFRSGRWKKIIPVSSPLRFAERAIVCLLARGDRAGLAPLEQEQAALALTADPEPGYQFYGEHSLVAARALTADGAWRLTLSPDPAEAIALVRRAFAPDARERPSRFGAA